MLASDTPMLKLLGRKAIGHKLKEENKRFKKVKMYAKYKVQSKATGFTFNVVEVAEAEKLVESSIK